MSDEVARDEVLRVRADEWRATAERLRADGFDFLQNLTAVDWIKQERIELVYHLWSYARRIGTSASSSICSASPSRGTPICGAS